MPRTGGGIYNLPSGVLADTGALILAEQHNSPLQDIANDLNAARPVSTGGTGATTAADARTNLGVYSATEVNQGFTKRIATKTALKALDTALYKSAFLEEAGVQKMFAYTLGDFTDAVAGDPSEISYIPADGVSVSIGCWVAVTGAGSSVQPIAAGGTGAVTASAARTALGLEIGTDVQAQTIYATAVEVSSRNVPASTTALLTNGYYTVDDGGGAQYYRKAVIEADTGGDLQSNGSTVRWGLIRKKSNLLMFGAKGDGTTDDTAKIVAALASGIRLVGLGRTYGVTGKISLPDNAFLWDTGLKQLAPGASLDVITLEADTKTGLDLRRVWVDRNGDGTNGGLLDASGTNGALNSAFAMRFIGCSDSHFEDLEVFGNDSGTGIHFLSIGESSRIIRPYAHDMLWSRTAATDDQVQGIVIDACTRCPVIEPRAINLTGVLNGTPTRRFTRGVVLTQNLAITVFLPYVERVDQGIDLTATGTGNREVLVESPVVWDAWTWGVKLAHAARRCIVNKGRVYRSGSSYTIAGNGSIAPEISTDRSAFVDCLAFDTGANGQTVIPAIAFRVGDQGATPPGIANHTWLVRCKAIDEQAVKTMEYGFWTDITDPAVAPVLVDCESIGHITAAVSGIFKRPQSFGTVSQSSGYQTGDIIERGSNANGQYVRYADGTQHCWTVLDDTATAWDVAHGAAFVRATPALFTFPKTFSVAPTVTASARRDASGVAVGASIGDVDTSHVTVTPYCFVALGAGNGKFIHIHAVGRWY